MSKMMICPEKDCKIDCNFRLPHKNVGTCTASSYCPACIPIDSKPKEEIIERLVSAIERAWWEIDAKTENAKRFMPTPKEHLNVSGDKKKYLDAVIKALSSHGFGDIEQAKREERERLWGELEDIRCNVGGEYLVRIERLMKSLKEGE